MIAARHAQARLLAKLRQVRLDAANRALVEARQAAERAEVARTLAEQGALGADAALANHRDGLAADPSDAPARMALIERGLFLQAVARSAFNDAAAALEDCERAAEARRHAMILARARADVVADQARGLGARHAARIEELAEIETEDRRR